MRAVGHTPETPLPTGGLQTHIIYNKMDNQKTNKQGNSSFLLKLKLAMLQNMNINVISKVTCTNSYAVFFLQMQY